ncbi:hypothetical protein [Brevibacillus fulvus]|uniref:1,2-phenylacetyl-CoA epoxidase PaaB subunit n=1 Tax=Brevibacillus fulvus TaxID=1125967 RepID=A0A938XW29_9BACL|nr:hypothetical protein [Brevibacillus fulvus]MBM7589164.1 1,2-phenylacetyl-CoA epoxidase PaaB subunit [Brevibacillus fulvus]
MSAVQTRYEYDVFTRIKRGDDLVHIGTVAAPSDELAKVYAKAVYDEENWVEMCVVPRRHIKWVKQPEGLFEAEGGR